MTSPSIEITPPDSATKASLSVFGRAEWFTAPEESSIWVRVYTILAVPREEMEALGARVPRELALDHPVALTVGYIGDFKHPHSDYRFHANEAGQLVVRVNISEQALPNAFYATLATPYRGDGYDGHEGAARIRLGRASALLTMAYGYNFLHDLVFDGEVEMGSGKYATPGPSIQTIQLGHGPFRYPDAAPALSELCERLAATPPEVRQRITLALDFFEQSVRQVDTFFYLWTALEILCNGKAQRIRSLLEKCYGFKSRADVDAGLGFATVAKWRHDYFHKGIRPYLGADVERYIQLLFWDLLRASLSLPHEGFALGMSQSAGFDLSAVDLADRRTPTQIAAIERSRSIMEPQQHKNGARCADV